MSVIAMILVACVVAAGDVDDALPSDAQWVLRQTGSSRSVSYQCPECRSWNLASESRAVCEGCGKTYSIERLEPVRAEAHDARIRELEAQVEELEAQVGRLRLRPAPRDRRAEQQFWDAKIAGWDNWSSAEWSPRWSDQDLQRWREATIEADRLEMERMLREGGSSREA